MRGLRPRWAPLDERAANAARDYVAELPAEQFPNLRAVAEHFGQGDNDQSFELLIDLFVDGLAQRVRAYAEKPKPRPETPADPERSAR